VFEGEILRAFIPTDMAPPGDIPVATATIDEPGTAPKPQVTFFSVQGRNDILHFNAPGRTEILDLPATTWVQAFRFYYWEPAANIIRWGTTEGDTAHPPVPITNPPATVNPTDKILSTIALTSTISTGTLLPITTNAVIFPSSTVTPPSSSSPALSASQNPTSEPEPSGIKAGAVAGVAIGCLIAGALIAGLLVWFLVGRRRKAASAQYHESSAVTLINREKGANAQVTSVASGSPIPKAIENGLPQPLEDQAISGEVSKISNAIKNHVQSFYHNGKVSPGLLDLDDLQGLGSNLPMSTGTLSTLLGNSDTREIALRFCIAWVAVSRMQLEAHPSTTFLPPEVTECFLSMTPEDRGPRGRMSQSINMNLTNPAIAHALYMSKWRVITAELLQSVYVRNPFSAVDPRSQNIKAAINVLEGILQPYADSRVDNTQRRRNLEEILKRSALFAFTLFSQPSSWKFDWQDEEVFKSGSLCVFPALVQVTDENGDSVKPPRPFSEAVIRRLDE
jgi:hypothetical protein